MGVIRVEHTRDYTVMSNCHLRDDRLSLRAIGLMSKMLSNTDDYQYTVSGLSARCKEGRDAVRKALQELEAAGYLVREQGHGENGKFGSNDYVLYEHPQTEPEEEPPLTENPSTAAPLTEKPLADLPLTVNPPQRNTKTKEVLSIIPPIVPHEGDGASEKPKRRRRAAKSVPEHEPEMFERFWTAYPRGEDRQGAVREWDKLKPDRELMFCMSAALSRQKKSEDWLRGIGIPYACRWLSKRRWTDRAAPVNDRPEAGGWAESREVL